MDLDEKPILSKICGKTKEEDLSNRKLVQTQLRNIANSIRGIGPTVDYCIDLRKTLQNCPDPENYHDTMMKDAGEFLTYILSMFPVNTAQRRINTYGTNKLDNLNINTIDEQDLKTSEFEKTSEIWDCKASVVNYVPYDILDKAPNGINISKFLNKIEDSGELTSDNLFKPYGKNSDIQYKRRIAFDSLKYSPYLIFNIKRIGINYYTSEEIFNNKNIYPEQYVYLPNGQKFELSAIVIYTGGLHYVCTFKCENKWYFYNDLGTSGNYEIFELGSDYSDVVENSPYNPDTNGTQFYYIPVNKVPDPSKCPPS